MPPPDEIGPETALVVATRGTGGTLKRRIEAVPPVIPRGGIRIWGASARIKGILSRDDEPCRRGVGIGR